MKYRFYTITEKVWQAMLEVIKGAQYSIYLETYIFEDDLTSRNLIDVLKEKSQQGVVVKIIIDSIGSFWFRSKTIKELEASGIEILFFSPLIAWRNPYRLIRNSWFYRTHRKILVVDEEIGFLGGVNIGKRFVQWLDLHIQLTGPVVRHFAKSFKRSYRFCGGNDPRVLYTKIKPIPRYLRHRLLERWPRVRDSALKQYYRKQCRLAQKQIIIVTPYFVPPRWLIKDLRQAVRRGIKIEVFLPRETDIKIMNAANYFFAALLQPLGIKFLLIPQMMHAKAFLIDGQEGLIGSNNIDAQSFDFNLEASVVFQRRDMVGDLKKILDRWRKSAIPLERLRYRLTWRHKILGFFVRFLQPIL